MKWYCCIKILNGKTLKFFNNLYDTAGDALHRHTRVSLVMFAPECDEWEVTPIAFSICMKY